MDYILISSFLCILVGGVSSWCPPHTSIRRAPIASQSRPRLQHQSCCQGSDLACSCDQGLQCCPNTRLSFLCMVDPCDPNPCGNGVCATDSAGRRKCFCAVGTTLGPTGLCIDNPCFRNPCGRGGRCLTTGAQGNNYRCRCSGDQIFNGKTCAASTCNRLRCGEGRCRVSGGRAVCNCPTGFTFDGRSCRQVNPCRGHTCGAGGRCSVVSRRAVCTCSRGFRLDSQTKECITDDPCSRANCGRGTCTISGFQAVCNCDLGFRFDRRESTCVLTNDLCQGVTCGGRGRCRIDRNRAVCECNAGFVFHQRRRTCIFDPCNRLACGRGSCVLDRSKVRARCQCDEGFNFNGRTCAAPTTTTTTTTTPSPRGLAAPVRAVLGGSCTSTSCTCNQGFHFNRDTVTCQVNGPCLAPTTLSTLDLGDSGNQRISAGTTSGCLKSRNFPQTYPNDLFDEVTIPTSGFSRLVVTIQDMQIQTAGASSSGFVQNNCFTDFLFVSGQLFCGSLDTPGAHRVLTINLQGRVEVIVGMVSDERTSSRGFLLKWELS